MDLVPRGRDAAEDPFAGHLNPAQAEAVAHVDGPLLVFAGAGSGKTRVITFRVANLVARHGVPPYRILAVTFTNKAAAEMRHRLRELLGEAVADDLWIGTFHAVCARLLRRYHDEVGLSREFVIYDDSDQKAVLVRCMKALGYDDRQYAPREVLGQIHRAKQVGRTPDELREDARVDPVIASCFEAYEQAMRAASAVDFDDLLLHVMRLATGEGRASEELRARFSHVLVDEFQDTNQVQYTLVRALASSRNLCVVGDDDQSIYRWRGADVRIIRGFARDFSDAKVVKLEENYRSTARVVRAALSVIQKSWEREPKALFTSNPPGDPIQIVRARDERDEAAVAVGAVRDALSRGVSPSEVAIFYRVHAMSRVLEEAFLSAKVPFRIVGGTRFYERAEIKDVLAYVRALSNPRSDVDVLRVIKVPPRGIGDTTIARLSEVAIARATSIYDAIDWARSSDELPTAAKKRLTAFFETIEALRAAAAELTPTALVARLLDDTGYLKMLAAQDTAESDARRENLEELLGAIEEYEAAESDGERTPTLSGFLEKISLATAGDERDTGPRVSLMTVHSAKGLEFDTVVITGLEETIFPYERTSTGEMDEEEERRLAYVAITRAKRRLTLVHTLQRTLFGELRGGRPSRFLRDLPRDDVDDLETRHVGVSSPASPRPLASPAWRGGPSAPSASAPLRPPRRAAAPEPIPARAPGERWVDLDAPEVATGLGPGVIVRHPRFGEGVVRAFEGGNDPSVVVRFKAWGEKRVKVRFLAPP